MASQASTYVIVPASLGEKHARRQLSQLNAEYDRSTSWSELLALVRRHESALRGPTGYVYLCVDEDDDELFRIGMATDPVKRVRRLKGYRSVANVPSVNTALAERLILAELKDYIREDNREVLEIDDRDDDDIVGLCRYYCRLADLIMESQSYRRYDINTCSSANLGEIYKIGPDAVAKILRARPIRSYDEVDVKSQKRDQLRKYTYIAEAPARAEPRAEVKVIRAEVASLRHEVATLRAEVRAPRAVESKADGRIRINSATADDLKGTLIGPVLSQKIVAFIETHGRITRWSQLEGKIPQLGPKRLEILRDKCSLA